MFELPAYIFELVVLNAIIDSILGVCIGLILVAKYAGKQAQQHTEAWFLSQDARPVLSKISSAVREDVMGDVPTKADIETMMAGMEARIHAEIPPNVHGELDEVRQFMQGLDERIAGAFSTIRAEMASMPATIEARIQQMELARTGREARELYKEMGATDQELDQVMQARDPMLAVVRRISAWKLPEDKAGTWGGMALEIGRSILLQQIQAGGLGLPVPTRRGRSPALTSGQVAVGNPFLRELSP